MRKRISIIFGTRPEAIKLAPVILALRETGQTDVQVCVTGQHREMLDQALKVFSITPDFDVQLMRENQSLASLTAKAISSLFDYLEASKPDWVVVQGDTTTTFCATLASFYAGIPVAHIEAGLRTHDKSAPFPEEANRVMTSHLASLHFAPTETARRHLLAEGISADAIYVTGNTVIDALHIAVEKSAHLKEIPGLPDPVFSNTAGRLVLITGHRRENFGDKFKEICQAISFLAAQYVDVQFVYPVHLNPHVRQPVFDILAGHPNVHLIEPLSYLPFVALLNKCSFVLTDSGGIQEEAPSLGKPVLVMRDVTERPEAVEAGTVKLVGTSKDCIVEETTRLLTDTNAHRAMSAAHNPYGDGNAAGRIAALLMNSMIPQSWEVVQR